MRSKFVGPSNMVIYESPGNQAAGQLASGQQIEAAPITSLKPQLRWPKKKTLPEELELRATVTLGCYNQTESQVYRRTRSSQDYQSRLGISA